MRCTAGIRKPTIQRAYTLEEMAGTSGSSGDAFSGGIRCIYERKTD